jgi:hypothetical protein
MLVLWHPAMTFRLKNEGGLSHSSGLANIWNASALRQIGQSASWFPAGLCGTRK